VAFARARVHMTLTLAVLCAAWMLSPLAPPAPLRLRQPVRAAAVTLQAGFADDGQEVDWDKEANKLDQLARPMNPYYKALSSVEAPELIREFAKTAPKEVQFAVKTTVASLLGNMPPAVGDSSITTTGKNLATLMFNMQMTGYMFRNAEIRRSLVGSMDKSLGPAEGATALPPVSGTVSIKLGPGMEAEVDAAAYMSELRTEVEGLRAELAKTRESEGGGEQALIAYIQGLGRDDQQQLTNDVSSEVLEAMSQLVATILIDLNIERDAEMEAPSDKLRELLIWQLVSGYNLRELEVRDNLKDKFWGADGKGSE